MADPTLDRYAKTLAPPAYDRTEASARRTLVQDALRRSTLAVKSMFESGSWSHGTAIKENSDVDYMAVATGARPTYPSSALSSAKRAIENCDWKITSVGVSSPVVQVKYYTPPYFEIAPAWYKGKTSGWDVYWIGGRRDEWVESAPAAHLDYVNTHNDRLYKELKLLVRLMKAWKYHVSAPVSSFYLEMRTAEHAAGEKVIVYELDMCQVMRKIVNANGRDMNDPAHIVGRIPACSSDEKRRIVIRQLNAAIGSLEAAESARAREDRAGYWVAMREVFGGDYPWPTW